MLTHSRDAVNPGYSTLLINEIVLPDEKCSYWGAAFDVLTRAIVNGRERTKNDWVELLGSVQGLRIEKIWNLEVTGENVIKVSRLE